MILHILRNQDAYVTIMFNCNYNGEQTVITMTEEQLTQRMINISKSKHTNIQPEYQSSAFFNRSWSISFLLAKQKCAHRQQLKLKNGLNKMSSFKTLAILSSLANAQANQVCVCVYLEVCFPGSTLHVQISVFNYSKFYHSKHLSNYLLLRMT